MSELVMVVVTDRTTGRLVDGCVTERASTLARMLRKYQQTYWDERYWIQQVTMKDTE